MAMRILIACDKFKGSMSAAEACAAIAAGLANADADGEIETVELPVADGGEGMSRAISDALGGEWIEREVQDPLGRQVIAGYGWVADDKLAIVEMSQASGLWRVAESELDPWRASTFGTGQLIADALKRGARELIIGLGGSATNDGGLGMAEALGCDLEKAAIAPAIVSGGVRVTVACDVRNPLLGENGCTRIYGPQKGMVDADFARHEARLRKLVGRVKEGEALAEVEGAGAAGGLGFGCLAFLGGELRPGFDLIADSIGLEQAMSAVDLVITGEGSLDAQSLEGKAPSGVAAMARRLEKPVVAFAGVADEAVGAVFDRVWQIKPPEISTQESMARGAELLESAAREAWFELRVLR